jgi:CubicO group peptidase (beta-lactamase class C family)
MAGWVSPETIGLDPERMERAYGFLSPQVDAGRVPGAVLMVGRDDAALEPRCFGWMDADAPSGARRPVAPETVFLLASVTKPVTATATMLLVERGALLLDQCVCDFIPEFGTHGKETTTVRHLLTHTSGLPDMLPEDRALRRRHAPLSEFVHRVCELAPLFPPGSNVQYQSMGFAVLAEIVERVAGASFREFLSSELFCPLGMRRCALGVSDDWADAIARVNVPDEMRGSDWGWNSRYWRGFGAPWGGLLGRCSNLVAAAAV